MAFFSHISDNLIDIFINFYFLKNFFLYRINISMITDLNKFLYNILRERKGKVFKYNWTLLNMDKSLLALQFLLRPFIFFTERINTG
jgi:hypothetical protein